MERGNVYVGTTVFNDCSYGDVHFFLPLIHFPENDSWLCFSAKGNCGYGDLGIEIISGNNFEDRIINRSGKVVIFGTIPLNKMFAEIMFECIKRCLHTGLQAVIITTLAACGALEKRETNLALSDLIKQGACGDGLKWWVEKFGDRHVSLEEAMQGAPLIFKNWLSNTYEYGKKWDEEKVKKFIFDMVKE